MGLLDQKYYDDLLKEGSNPTTAPVVSAPTPTTTIGPTPQASTTPAPITEDKFPDLSEADQIKRFGTTVGSPEYFKQQADKGMLRRLPGEAFSAFGGELPPQEEWAKMSRNEQAMNITGETLKIPLKLIFGFPKAVASIPIGITKTIGEGWRKITGKEETPKPVEDPNKPVSFIQSVPSYFDTFDDAKAKGMGNWVRA